MGNYRYAGPDEVLNEIEALLENPAIIQKHILKARYLLPTSAHETPQSLVFEAIKRIESGTRRWPIEVNFNTFLDNVVKSLASEYNKKSERLGDIEVILDPKVLNELFWKESENKNLTPEESVFEKEKLIKVQKILETIYNNFDDDENVMAIIMGYEDALRASEIKELFGLTDNQFDSAKKRLRRYINKTYPAGLLI